MNIKLQARTVVGPLQNNTQRKLSKKEPCNWSVSNFMYECGSPHQHERIIDNEVPCSVTPNQTIKRKYRQRRTKLTSEILGHRQYRIEGFPGGRHPQPARLPFRLLSFASAANMHEYISTCRETYRNKIDTGQATRTTLLARAVWSTQTHNFSHKQIEFRETVYSTIDITRNNTRNTTDSPFLNDSQIANNK
jgi:hypothetical protein